jgi:hypothetical protein
MKKIIRNIAVALTSLLSLFGGTCTGVRPENQGGPPAGIDTGRTRDFRLSQQLSLPGRHAPVSPAWPADLDKHKNDI